VKLRKIENIVLSLHELTESTILRLYTKDGLGVYRLVDRVTYPDDFLAEMKAVVVREISLDTDVKVTMESLVAEAEARTIPYKYVIRSLA